MVSRACSSNPFDTVESTRIPYQFQTTLVWLEFFIARGRFIYLSKCLTLQGGEKGNIQVGGLFQINSDRGVV